MLEVRSAVFTSLFWCKCKADVACYGWFTELAFRVKCLTFVPPIPNETRPEEAVFFPILLKISAFA